MLKTKKGTKSKQKFSPFVEIRSHEGTFFIRKTTAVWLLQESERVSSDRLFRVRCKQPFDCKLTSHLSTHKTPLSMLVESPSLPEKSPAEVSKVEQKDALVVSEAEQKDALVASEVGHMQKDVLVASEVLKMEEKDTLVASASIGVPKVEDKVAQNEQVIYVNDDDNELDTPSLPWLKLNGISLYLNDKVDLLSDTIWLNGSHMTAVQLLLKQQFPNLGSLEDTIQQERGLKPIQANSLQILLVNRNHWVTVSTLTADSKDITLYDSKYSVIHYDTQRLLSQLVCTQRKSFTARIATVNKQAGDNDCGLFAAAYCTTLAYGQNPSAFVYDQARMRNHLYDCLSAKKMTPFPIIRNRRVGEAKTVEIKVYCYCRGPNDGNPMVQCEAKKCKEWFHLGCVDAYVKREKWYCRNCNSREHAMKHI